MNLEKFKAQLSSDALEFFENEFYPKYKEEFAKDPVPFWVLREYLDYRTYHGGLAKDKEEYDKAVEDRTKARFGLKNTCPREEAPAPLFGAIKEDSHPVPNRPIVDVPHEVISTELNNELNLCIKVWNEFEKKHRQKGICSNSGSLESL